MLYVNTHTWRGAKSGLGYEGCERHSRRMSSGWSAASPGVATSNIGATRPGCETQDGETPVNVCLLDLQISRYTSPMTDITYFLYCCTQGHVRREVYKSLLSDYYDSFSQFLKSLGSDPEKMFPYSAFKEHERKFSEFGLGMATMVLPVVTAPKEDVIDSEDPNGHIDDFLEKRATDDRLLERMSDIVEDMVNNDFI